MQIDVCHVSSCEFLCVFSGILPAQYPTEDTVSTMS